MAALAKEYRVYISEWARVPEGRPSLRRHAGDRGGLLRPLSRGTLWLRLTSFSLTRFASPTSVPSRTTLCADAARAGRETPLSARTLLSPTELLIMFSLRAVCFCVGITETVNRSINQSITFKSPSLVPVVICIFLVYLFLQPSGRLRCFEFLLELPKGQI